MLQITFSVENTKQKTKELMESEVKTFNEQHTVSLSLSADMIELSSPTNLFLLDSNHSNKISVYYLFIYLIVLNFGV